MSKGFTKPKAQIITEEEGEEKVVNFSTTGPEDNELVTQDVHGYLLKEILLELKISNQYLEQIVGDENRVTESDIEIK